MEALDVIFGLPAARCPTPLLTGLSVPESFKGEVTVTKSGLRASIEGSRCQPRTQQGRFKPFPKSCLRGPIEGSDVIFGLSNVDSSPFRVREQGPCSVFVDFQSLDVTCALSNVGHTPSGIENKGFVLNLLISKVLLKKVLLKAPMSFSD